MEGWNRDSLGNVLSISLNYVDWAEAVSSGGGGGAGGGGELGYDKPGEPMAHLEMRSPRMVLHPHVCAPQHTSSLASTTCWSHSSGKSKERGDFPAE